MTSPARRKSTPRRSRAGLALVILVTLGLTVTFAVGGSIRPPAADAGSTSPAPVALGSAGNFSVLGASVSNNDTSSFEHDIGASPGAIVGFPPGGTSGTIHSNDQAAMDGISAASAAYSDAAARTPTGTVSGDLSAITLTPGVYRAAAALSNTGTLTLDGQGNTNAVFIFQVDAAFSMAAGTKIQLINGVMATNVFWQVQGAVGIGADATFSGMLLANAAVSLGADDTLIGSVLSLNGAISIDGSSVSTSPGFNGAGSAPQLVALGTAGNFSLLGSSINNAGATHSNFDVGVTPGTITGFPPGTTSGTIHTDDSTAVQAMHDLSAAYTIAATRSRTALIAGDLNGQTFTAGVYRADAAVGVTGTITLDGAGDSSSVFIFQAKGALGIGAGVRIVLVNNAQPGNVFWQVAGAASVGSGAHFAGTILGNAAISIGTGATLAGAALTQNGEISLNVNSVTSAPGYSGALSSTISGARFSSVILTGLSATLSSPAQSQWTVTDTRMNPTAWDLIVTATMSTSAAGTIDSTPRMFPAGSLTLLPGVVTARSGNTSAIHSQSVVLSDQPHRIVWSDGSNGVFAFTPTFSLTVPANAYRSNFSGSVTEANSNPYVSTITVTIG